MGEDQRAEGLAGEGEARPFGGGDVVAGVEVNEADERGVEVDVEAGADGGEDCGFGGCVVAGVDDV